MKCGYVFTKIGVLINHDVSCFKRVLFCAQMFSLIKPFHTGKLNMTYNRKICVLWWYKMILLKNGQMFFFAN